MISKTAKVASLVLAHDGEDRVQNVGLLPVRGASRASPLSRAGYGQALVTVLGSATMFGGTDAARMLGRLL